MNKNLSEEKKKYEKEFCSLLIQRITHAGGSLQFQHLCGLIQQARFEIRNAFGATKSELMKFLKSHPNIFQIDSAGIVTISDSPFSDDDSNKDTYANIETKHDKIVHPKIEKGVGYILRKRADFGIIKAAEPIKTHVHFKPQAFFNNKDCLLSVSSLQEGDEVYFNAVHGYDDYDHNDIKFSATKVWHKFDESKNSNITLNPSVSNELNDHGIIKGLRADGGYISTSSLEKIFFHKTSVKDCDCDDLTQFLRNEDRVEFSATKLHNDKSSRWHATSVRKKSQNVKSSTDTNLVKNKLENEPGKIYPNSTGAVIKFGKNFSEQADGNSCSYFFYGGEVTDINFEFNEGDDIFFDAVKTRSAAKWKAVLVWVGEKPVCFNYNKTFSGNKKEVSDNESVLSLKAVSINPSLNPITKRSRSASESKILEQNKISDHSNSRKYGKYNERFNKQISKPQNSENIFTRKSRNGNERKMNEKDNSFVNKRVRNKNKIINERKFPSRVEHKKSLFRKNVTATYESDDENNKASNFMSHFTKKDDYSNSSQYNSDEDIKSHKNLVTKKDKSYLSAPRPNFLSTSDNDINNMLNEIKSDNNDNKKMASIRKFDDVEGKIVNLYCKAALIESSCLQKNVDFMLNAFYLNGKSVEEQQVIDLKEVIKVGDKIKFNCFEIIDDVGEIHQKVTMAWKGLKPLVYEMTPEEFISQYDLSVTINNELDFESLSGEITSQKNSIGSSSTESFSESASEEEVSNDEDSKKSNSDSVEKKDERGEVENKILDINKSLSETTLERLKYKGLIPSDVQVDFSGLLTEATNLVQKHYDLCKSAPLNEPEKENSKTLSKPICLLCEKACFEESKNENSIESQTIITGGIIAQSIYTPP